MLVPEEDPELEFFPPSCQRAGKQCHELAALQVSHNKRRGVVPLAL